MLIVVMSLACIMNSCSTKTNHDSIYESKKTVTCIYVAQYDLTIWAHIAIREMFGNISVSKNHVESMSADSSLILLNGFKVEVSTNVIKFNGRNLGKEEKASRNIVITDFNYITNAFIATFR